MWNYSSGTTNIVSRLVGDAVGGGRTAWSGSCTSGCSARSACTVLLPKFDTAGTFVGSSYVYATARDFAKFGQLYLDDGIVGGRRVLPVGGATTPVRIVAHDDDGARLRPALVAVAGPREPGVHGYEGQYTIVAPTATSSSSILARVPPSHARS